MVFLGMANTLMQTRTPDHLRGRAMSVHTMSSWGSCRSVRCSSDRSHGRRDRHRVLHRRLLVTATRCSPAVRASALRDALAEQRPRMVARSGSVFAFFRRVLPY